MEFDFVETSSVDAYNMKSLGPALADHQRLHLGHSEPVSYDTFLVAQGIESKPPMKQIQVLFTPE
jgi:hypothetical protein